MKTVEMKNPIANAMISLVFMVMPFGRATPVRVQASSPDERSDIRDRSNTAPDVASLIRATLAALIFDDFRLPQE